MSDFTFHRLKISVTIAGIFVPCCFYFISLLVATILLQCLFGNLYGQCTFAKYFPFILVGILINGKLSVWPLNLRNCNTFGISVLFTQISLLILLSLNPQTKPMPPCSFSLAKHPTKILDSLRAASET